jgi:hypothetical protein
VAHDFIDLPAALDANDEVEIGKVRTLHIQSCDNVTSCGRILSRQVGLEGLQYCWSSIQRGIEIAAASQTFLRILCSIGTS